MDGDVGRYLKTMMIILSGALHCGEWCSGGWCLGHQERGCEWRVWISEIMMGVGNRVASVIMLTFPSEPCPHADFSK